MNPSHEQDLAGAERRAAGLAYRGQRHAGEATVLVTGADGHQRPLDHHVRHSPGGLEWGYGGSGPADLARSILADRIGWPPPPRVYQQFKREVVAGLPRDGFELAAARVDAWLDRHYPLARQLADRADHLQVQLIELASRVEEHVLDHGDDCARGERLAWRLAQVADRLGELASQGRQPALQLRGQAAVQRAQPNRDDPGLQLP